jgi:hypothetical protein
LRLNRYMNFSSRRYLSERTRRTSSISAFFGPQQVHAGGDVLRVHAAAATRSVDRQQVPEVVAELGQPLQTLPTGDDIRLAVCSELESALRSELDLAVDVVA